MLRVDPVTLHTAQIYTKDALTGYTTSSLIPRTPFEIHSDLNVK